MTEVLVPWYEVAAQEFEGGKTTDSDGVISFAAPGDLAAFVKPKTVVTPALELIDRVLIDAFNTPDSRTIITMAPQEGKSERAASDFPLWALQQNKDLRIVLASYGQGLANRNGRSIRNKIIANPELGLTIAPDNGAAGEWELGDCPGCWLGEGRPPEGKHTRGHVGGVYSVGIGGGVTGRACDLMIIDDPIKSRQEADSKVYRDKIWDWWTDEASTRLGPGAPVVLILTRWHHDDLAGRLLAEEGSTWQVYNIPAQADHKPEEGETDLLDREPGEFMISARGRTTEQWELRKKTSGSRTWASLFQGRPTPDSGNLFPLDGWSRYTVPMYLIRDNGSRWVPGMERGDCEMVQSWDFTFKDTESSDYVCGQVWLRRGVDAYLLDQVRGQLSFSESCQAMIDMTVRWPQAIAKLVEDKANGPAIMNALRHRVGGLIPVNPEGSKYARAAAITPLVEAKNVHLPDPVAEALVPYEMAWVTTLTEEARDFPQGTHDDTVDAMSQAVHRLLLVDIVDPTDIRDVDDFLDDGEGLDWAVSY